MAVCLQIIKHNALFGIRNLKLVLITPKRSIMTTRVRLEKVLEDLKKNPYFDKYVQKISKLQETRPEEFLERVEQKQNQIQEDKEKRAKMKSFQQTFTAKIALDPKLQTKEAKLDDIMKVEMIVNKSKEEIINIWQQYHKQKNCISGILTCQQFEKMFERGRKYSTFLLPLPREQGYEFIVIQFHGTSIHMTPLLWYQTHKENAPECLTMTHYIELIESKKIVLMRGEFDSNSINVQEAQCLANEVQLYYALDDPARLRLLDIFTNKPDEFKHMDLIHQVETVSFNTSPSVASNPAK